jgi:hypothetical protein
MRRVTRRPINLSATAQYQIDQQPQAQKSSALRSELRKNNAAEIY